ncbi:MAG: hypothetical protein JZU65_20905 [Chlorobium sp.]|nr:hypothetical protein [Chlorobium sp.]
MRSIISNFDVEQQGYLSRRVFLKAIAVCLASPYFDSEAHSSQGPFKQATTHNTLSGEGANVCKNNNFKLFDQLNFKKHPDFTKLGLKPITVIYADQMWPDKIKRDVLDKDFLSRRFGQKPLLGDGSLLCLDIEHWKLRRVDETTFRKNVELYKESLNVFRKIYPGAKIGLFEFAPLSFYPLYHQVANGNIEQKLYDQWAIERERLRPITDNVDVLFPQLYSRWPTNVEGWERCAKFVMKQAREIAVNRPVIPFIWPQFWVDGEPLVAGDYWKRILHTMCELADSAVIWSIYQTAPVWDPDMDWWQETLSFLGKRL